MNFTLAQFNPTVGDLEGNYQAAKKIVNESPDSDLIIFPELSVVGYPPKDLLLKPAFVDAAMDYTEKWAQLAPGKQGIIFGNVEWTKQKRMGHPAKPLQNCAYLAHDGEVAQSTEKTLLPTYDVFDEARYFEPSIGTRYMFFRGCKLGVSICEDIWNDKEFWKDHIYADDPIERLVVQGAEILINISASPFVLGKPEIRKKMLSHIASKYNMALLYVNQVGGNDDVVYDGRSLAFPPDGSLFMEMSPFKEETRTVVINIDKKNKKEPATIIRSLQSERCEEREIYDALVLGTRDYARKTGFKKAVLGLSGGIDSAIVAVVAAAAFGKENVLGVGMPSKYSSDHSVNDARGIAEKLGIEFQVIPIKPAHDAYLEMMRFRFNPNNAAEDSFDVRPWEENIQARARGATLMAISNEENRLLLTTGNKSEVAVGYCTLYGDTCGGLAVISDVFKTKVFKLAKWINRGGQEIIPANTINKPPSAELRPNQKDQDSLPPYDLLDLILGMYVEDALEFDTIITELIERQCITETFTEKHVKELIRKVDKMEYKRKQLAPGIKITKRAFGTGWQMPIAERWMG